jgi:aminocarboxymuconate-semialdehyde decarboxylase
MKEGHVGVEIGNHVGDQDLDHPALIDFLIHCASVDCPVFVHPWDMDDMHGRNKKYMMAWTVGMPLEVHLSISSMILSGAFDRLPRNLKICFAHGGGAFPGLLGRLENAWLEREVARGNSEYPPSHYVDRFSVDSAVFDPRALQLLVSTMGAERIMLGSDYPFPLGEQNIGKLVRNAARDGQVSQSDAGRILSGNAVDFFSL